MLEVFLAASCVDAPACEGRASCGPSGCEPIDRPWPDWSPALGRGACVDPELDGGVTPDVPVPPDAPACPTGTTRCGAACRDLATDVAHCGRCGAACAPSNGSGACMAGRCVIASCAAGWADCDGATSNGCEANLATSATHCGRCNNRCATGACAAGTCEAATPVILRNFGGSTGFGPDEQCLHPTDEDAWAGPPPVGAMPAARPIPLNFAFARGLSLGTRTLTQMFVNANGTVSFIDPVPAFDATNDVRSSQPVLAPWWADVDTRLGGFPSQNVICFALQPGIVAATWFEVGYYDRRIATRDTFQVVMREVATPDDWDLEFRYGQCQWTTGDASEGISGLGGTPAVAGLLPGDNLAFLPLPGSGTNAVLDLCTTSNTGQAGVWRMRVRRGAPAL
ncbi:MAG: nidogen-like domain-containing protein [Polyangiales bacterium]